MPLKIVMVAAITAMELASEQNLVSIEDSSRSPHLEAHNSPDKLVPCVGYDPEVPALLVRGHGDATKLHSVHEVMPLNILILRVV
jgi:hypothetical protein